jgi:NADH-quinone oxidoreductase subunit L
MFSRFADEPGLLYVAATLIPLASFTALLLAGGLKNLGRTYREQNWGGSLYWLLGGDQPGRGGAYLATGAIALSCLLSLIGLGRFLSEYPVVAYHGHAAHAAAEDHGPAPAEGPGHAHSGDAAFRGNPAPPKAWTGRVTWAKLDADETRPGVRLELGYYIDHLAAIMFAMVTFVATLIHIFALGYMADETQETVEDHQVHGEGGGHFRRRGRYGRFFMFFSLFCFSMLNLVLADNLFQVFVSWELVGVCSYLLIGFYYERQSASDAANKAFITNRVGDVGFIVGLMIVWTFIGTFNFQEVFARLRSPAADAHGPLANANQFVRLQPAGDPAPDGTVAMRWTPPDEPQGSYAALFPLQKGDADFHGIGPGEGRSREVAVRPDLRLNEYGAMPYWLLVVAGLGVFLGCVGKSAQFPLQVWLPDAMEGPTPVSALIHAATMVAAGVYLVGRCFPLFAPEALLVIAYTGGITLFVAATIAVVVTDIKKVLAYSTVSQLGYMMLALGIGGWVAGLLHLLTHAFFKALLFLGSGSVIAGCHHEQDMRKMGGLYARMPVTAWTMLIGVLAISGTPLFSGWYSKDMIIAESLKLSIVRPEHFLLLLLPLLTAGITCFYMFRMWFMTFAGAPKDDHVYEHAHESPRVMTVPLVVLAVFSVCVAWSWPLWNAEASYLGRVLRSAEPAAVEADFGHLLELVVGRPPENPGRLPAFHDLAGFLALAAAGLGVVFAYLVYYRHSFDPADAVEQAPGVYRLLVNKWYFDDFYRVAFVRPALVVAGWCRWFDARVIDGIVDGSARLTIRLSKWDGRFDNGVVDGLVNLVADVTYTVGAWLRRTQTGFLRSYILFLVLAAVGLFAALTWFVSLAAAR